MSLLCPDAFLSPLAIDEAVARALEEDLGRAGDVTSIATIPDGTRGTAVMVARKAGVIAGLPMAAAAFRKLDPAVEIKGHVRDGATVAAKTALMTITGDARALLGAERVALNFVGHLSGIATAASEFVRRIAHTKARVCCTRKTTPGLRALQKYAVRCGGGFNHRFGLDDAILIKDNHIAVAGGVRAVLERAKAVAGRRVSRRGAARQHGPRRHEAGGRHGGWAPGDRSVGRHHTRQRQGDRRIRRRLSVVGCDHPFVAQSRRRAGYRDLRSW